MKITLGWLKDHLETSASLEEIAAAMTDRTRPSLCAVKEYMSVAPYMDPHAAARMAGNLLSVVLSSPGDA